MAYNRKQEPVLGAAVVGMGLLLLPVTLPVALGVALAVLLEPVVLGLQRRLGLGRTAAAGIGVTGVLLCVGGGVYLLGGILVHEAAGLSDRIPQILESIAQGTARLTELVERAAQGLPEGVADALTAWSEGLLSGSGTLARTLYDGIFSLASRVLGALPGILFFLMTAVLSTYFAAGELPRLKDLGRTYLPSAVKRWAAAGARGMKTALRGWVWAQIKLMSVTFLVLTAGFLLLGVGSPVLLGALICLLDALPVFGTGTVLLPWALAAMLAGDVGRGMGLTALYGAAVLIRNVLEPKVLGQTLGLSPLLTLVGIYAGWRLAGLWGMIGLPVGMMAAVSVAGNLREYTPSGIQGEKSPKMDA